MKNYVLEMAEASVIVQRTKGFLGLDFTNLSSVIAVDFASTGMFGMFSRLPKSQDCRSSKATSSKGRIARKTNSFVRLGQHRFAATEEVGMVGKGRPGCLKEKSPAVHQPGFSGIKCKGRHRLPGTPPLPFVVPWVPPAVEDGELSCDAPDFFFAFFAFTGFSRSPVLEVP